MYEVICPACKKLREVAAKKKWMEGEQPFEKLCKPCSMTGKTKSAETKQKLSELAKKQQTPELLQFKSEFMKSHPELWQANLKPELGPIARLGTHHSDESKDKISTSNTGKVRSDETKTKISQAMKRKNNESK